MLTHPEGCDTHSCGLRLLGHQLQEKPAHGSSIFGIGFLIRGPCSIFAHFMHVHHSAPSRGSGGRRCFLSFTCLCVCKCRSSVTARTSSFDNKTEELLSTMVFSSCLVGTTRELNILAFDLDTQRILRFNLAHTGSSEDFHYVDIARLLSLANRKSYRQGMSYDVASIVFHDSDSSETYIKVCTAPNTWATQAAWQVGFRHWLAQQRSAADTVQAGFGPWFDFKVYINYAMIADVDKPTLIDSEDNTFTGGEWVYSKYLVPEDGSSDPDTASIGLMGDHNGTPFGGDMTYASLLEALENTINTPQEDPDLPMHDTLWAALSTDQADMEVVKEILEDFEADNDLPPYSPTVIPGAGAAGAGRPSDPWIARECCIQGGAHHMAAVGGFTAPCGLLVFETQQDDDDTIGVTLELMPGEYKGVSARPMRGGGR